MRIKSEGEQPGKTQGDKTDNQRRHGRLFADHPRRSGVGIRQIKFEAIGNRRTAGGYRHCWGGLRRLYGFELFDSHDVLYYITFSLTMASKRSSRSGNRCRFVRILQRNRTVEHERAVADKVSRTFKLEAFARLRGGKRRFGITRDDLQRIRVQILQKFGRPIL